MSATQTIYLAKVKGGLMKPVREEDEEALKDLKIGDAIRCKYARQRNPQMMRKFFALLKVGYEHWEPNGTYKGLPLVKNFDRFREDIIIAAGYYDLVVNIKGEARAKAKSISFGKMTEREFNKLYYAVVDVLIQMVLTNYTRTDVDEVVKILLKFAEDPYKQHRRHYENQS